jgi:ATP-dependent helicase HepA
MIDRPSFVLTESEPLGIGKLVNRSGNTAEVEFFESPFGPKLHRRCFKLGQIRAVELGLQTRVFWLDRATGLWRAGRVDGPPVRTKADGDAEDVYFIRFPNHNDRQIPVSDLYVRWSHPVADPAEFLAAQVSDTPFFADGRRAIVRHFLRQRAGFEGLTGLASSSIELIQHQVSIVRRVLADPVQRYILADEVGLGKTIEAGVLVRQHVLDHPWDHRVLIVVPGHLLQQWRSELATKFFLAENSQVALVSETELLERPVSDQLSLLVVDEAHRTAAFAFDTAAPEHRIYNKLQFLAHSARGVLLLSGTPVLHQETGFLAMCTSLIRMPTRLPI